VKTTVEGFDVDDFAFDSEPHIFSALDHLVGAAAILSGRGDMIEEQRLAAFRLVDDAADEVRALKELFLATAKAA
jgi:hypothetical protein